MSTSAIAAINEALKSYATSGPSDDYYKGLRDGANSGRAKLATMINVERDGVVFTESATQSINLVANGLNLQKDESIVTRGGASEHPSNYLPWRYYCNRKGVKIEDLDTDDFGIPDLSVLDSVLKQTKARLVVLSHVTYNLGTIMPASEVSKIAHERNALFFLDASQSVGNIRVDAKEIGCDFLAGTAAKWLCGPLGLGFFYVTQEALESLQPLNFGPNACTYTPDGKFEELKTPQRLQEGFRNWTFIYGLEAALDLWNDYGLEMIRKKNLELADMIIEKINSMPKRFDFLGTSQDNLRTSIVPVAANDFKSGELVMKLAKKGIVIAEREIREKKILRISPHFYNDVDEVGRVLEALAES